MEICTDDFLFLPARSALQGGYRGEAGLRRFFEDNAETFEVSTAMVYTFEAGRVVRGEDFRERDVALRAAGIDA